MDNRWNKLVLLCLLLSLLIVAPSRPSAAGDSVSPTVTPPSPLEALTAVGASELTDRAYISHVSPSPASFAASRYDSAALHKIEPMLLKAALQPDAGYLRFIVHVKRPPVLPSASVPTEKISARQALVNTLQQAAESSQRGLRVFLSKQQAKGRVASYKSFWIFNGLAVTADAETLFALAARSDVRQIRADHQRFLEPTTGGEPAPSPAKDVEWNVSHVRADLAWSAFGLDGEGVVVGIMDTGVDVQHPALLTRYRGYDTKGFLNHRGNWYSTTDEGYQYPGDGNGHGTHIAGIAVGSGGIGIAPGAQWIAVKVFHNQGYTFDSWLHDGFQWLMAPAGDLALAPDIVNASWGNDVSGDETFRDDVIALRQAGILPVFSAGNNGPSAASVGSPASFPETLAVGALDSDDEIVAFSGRGPSPWEEVKPEIVAPGIQIRSARPGGSYWIQSGTSVAAPHVSGIAALLLQEKPSLSVDQLEATLVGTAAPLGRPIPNQDTGWGRVDAYGAVISVAGAGYLAGHVTRAVDGGPITWGMIHVRRRDDGRSFAVPTDADGSYHLALRPDSYVVSAEAFGYRSVEAIGVTVVRALTTTMDLALELLPTGALFGRVTDLETGGPLTATISILDTPLSVETDPTRGTYSIALPPGSYQVRVVSPGHRIERVEGVTIEQGKGTSLDFALSPAPRIVLVDSGAWYYDSRIHYFQDALDDLGYLYNTWTIKDLERDLPRAEDLTPYEIAIWSSPQDSPGFIGATGTISGYLQSGGRLFITGQEIGYWDGGGTQLYFHTYYRDYLHARYVRDNAGTHDLIGLPGDLFDGLSLSLSGGDGADNQRWPDEVAVARPEHASPVIAYESLIPDEDLIRDQFLMPGAAPRRTETESRACSGGTLSKLRTPFTGQFLMPGAAPCRTETESRACSGGTLSKLRTPFTGQFLMPGAAPCRTETESRACSGGTLSKLRTPFTGQFLTPPAAPPGHESRVGSVTSGLHSRDRPERLFTGQGGIGGLRAGLCLPYRVLYLSFGFEGINSRATRIEVMGRILDNLLAPPPQVGLTLKALGPGIEPQRIKVGQPGQAITHTLSLRNTGQAEDVYQVNLSGNAWPTAAMNATFTMPLTSTVSITTCQKMSIGIEVSVPEQTGWNEADAVAVSVRSTTLPTVTAALTLTSKTPAPILLVDDDRWYQVEERYEESLSANGYPYDDWNVGWNTGDALGRPIGDMLPWYPFIVWFTGYDWNDTLTPAEEEALTAYLDGGGRLFLSAQDYLYSSGLTDFGVDYLGVLTYTESLSTTVATGVPGNPVGDGLGPYQLKYPYFNWSDGLELTETASAAFVGEDGQVNALTHAPPGSDFAAVFFAFPFETLPQDDAPQVMERIITFLHPLGASSLTADKDIAAEGDRLAYTLVLRNTDLQTGRDVVLTNVIPEPLTFVSGSLTGGGSYDRSRRLISWQGTVEPDQPVTITYQADLPTQVPDGLTVINTAEIADGTGIVLRPRAITRVDVPDLRASTKAVDRTVAAPGDRLTYTISLSNTGTVEGRLVSLVDAVPTRTVLITDTLWASSGTTEVHDRTVFWAGSVPVGQPVSVTYAVTVTVPHAGFILANRAQIDDGYGRVIERRATTFIPSLVYFPLILRRSGQ